MVMLMYYGKHIIFVEANMAHSFASYCISL